LLNQSTHFSVANSTASNDRPAAPGVTAECRVSRTAHAGFVLDALEQALHRDFEAEPPAPRAVGSMPAVVWTLFLELPPDGNLHSDDLHRELRPDWQELLQSEGGLARPATSIKRLRATLRSLADKPAAVTGAAGVWFRSGGLASRLA
jgi:hypothetical protein